MCFILVCFWIFILHEEWDQCIVHKDIKASNVILDLDFNAKRRDFDLVRFLYHVKDAQTTTLVGTVEYMSHECAIVERASNETNVYILGSLWKTTNTC